MTTGTIGRHLVRLAGVLVLAGFTVSCADNPQRAATVAPAGFGKDPISRAERLVSYCDRLADKGEMVTALGLCARAHEINPDDPETVMKIAEILHKLDRKQAAAQAYVSLIEQHPRHHEARYSLGKLYMEMGESAMAAAQFDRAIQTNPKDPRPYNALGILRDQAGEHQAAQALYRSALKRDPNNHSLRNNLGLSLALSGQRDEAIEVLAALAVDPEAHQTVLRNLEAAYASRPPSTVGPGMAPLGKTAPNADAAIEPLPSAPLAQPMKDPEAPDAPEPAAKMTSPAPKKTPSAPGKGDAPMPLFVPQPGSVGNGQQSGTQQSPATSTILAAAEQLMARPEWADFEPGALIGSAPAAEATAPMVLAPKAMAPKAMAPEASLPEAPAPETVAPETMAPEAMAPEAVAPAEPAASGGIGEISVDTMDLGEMSQPSEVGLSLLLVKHSSGSV